MASMAKYKAQLRTQIRRRAVAHEVNFLNITAMMDMMTIILVFLLKSMSASSANMPQTSDLSLPTSILSEAASQEGIQVVVSRDRIMVNGKEIANVQVPGCFNSVNEAPKATDPYKLVFCPGDSSHGFDAKYKGRGTAADLEIKDLFNAMENPVKVAEAQAATKPKDKGQGVVDAMILFDRYTSYRVMTEVMFTLGQAKVSKFHFLAMSAKTGSK
jgi:biopolymer transport protein ExbD